MPGDACDPFTGQGHLIEDERREIRPIAQSQVPVGETRVRLRQRHLDVVDHRSEERPARICIPKHVEIRDGGERGAESEPAGQVDSRLSPREHPRNGAQVLQ